MIEPRDWRALTILCPCCDGHTDDLVETARVCLDCGAYCQCRGCQADSAYKAESA